ncbi:ATP-dependent nuclease [Winogradskyella sediminis]|uniref:ATP-dependent nuclease n=1 Tax=Winogradskyella sediminis TaxID=1382466 RepID=UPI003AA9C6A6
MILKTITIRNFRSIDELTIDIHELEDKSFTYGLIGVNEAGKSSILRALAIKDNFEVIKPTIKDFRNPEVPIEVNYIYTLDKSEIKELKEEIKEKVSEDKLISKLKLTDVELKVSVSKEIPNRPSIDLFFYNETLDDSVLLTLVNEELKKTFQKNSFKSIFWKAEDKFLISKPIEIQTFSNNLNTSIPLTNCFKLAGIQNISKQLNLLNDSTEREYLQDILGEKVTEHINKVWTGHPIKITFNISDNHINFHVKDLKAIGKAKTATQRSDGFRQFISFLLTISVQYLNNELSDTILLLDEPETHLHPKAQEDLLKELIKITKASKNNIVFFATHSNYMIDKELLNRNIKVEKPEDSTVINNFTDKTSTYASVNYDVFNIASTDYHNELYSKVMEYSESKDVPSLDKVIFKLNDYYKIQKEYIQSTNKKYNCTLCTYIRHQIHHPENEFNKKFTAHELEKSIKVLKMILQKLQNKK